jgi:hypothetical protein
MNKLEKIFIVIASISLLVIIALFVLGYMSHSGQAHGLVEGRLMIQGHPLGKMSIGSTKIFS